jgi:peptide subunit release factor 1 (eRF1)
MITREQIQELARFEDPGDCAVSFYFQPATPRNKAHKEQAIETKDLAREALRQLQNRTPRKLRSGGKDQDRDKDKHKDKGKEKDNKSESAQADIARIIQRSQDWRGNVAHAKAIFACARQNFWREYDLPPQLRASELRIDRRFHLKPLAQLLGAFPSLGVALIDRQRARLFDLRLGELNEREGFFHTLTRRGRSDGFAGYDGGHAERRAADEARQHFKVVAEFLKDALEKRTFDHWILGCLDLHSPIFEAQLHPEVAQKLLGRFSSEVAHVSDDQIRSQAERIFTHWQTNRRRELVQETISQARANGRGVTGLRRVLRSLEMGVVQTLLLGEAFAGQAVECTACGHLDAHVVSMCPACGRETRGVVDVAEAILPWVIRHDIELFYVKDDAALDAVGNIAALLRFRPAQSGKIQPISEFADRQSTGSQPGRVGRYRGLASG